MTKFLLLLLALSTLTATAQTPQDSITQFHQKKVNINRCGMKALGSWAVGNMIASGIGIAVENDDQRKHFHMMNVGWNAVNVVIILPELLKRTHHAPSSDLQLMAQQNNIGKIFLFNAGLDLAYITGGVLVRHLQYSHPTDAAKWRGVGNGLIYNGVFLFLFDSVMYGINTSTDKKYFKTKGVSFYINPTSFSLCATL